jgi:protease-4
MKDFFKFMFASCFGVILSSLAIVGIFTCGVAAFGGDGKTKVEQSSILKLNFEEEIPELTGNLEQGAFEDKKLGLHDYKMLIENAKNDRKINGILLTSKMLSMSPASAALMRGWLLDFKKSGKFVVAYADYYSQGAYYMASAADAVWLNPSGMLDFRGVASNIPFFKDMLDRLGINVQIYYAGKFKSATEPFRLNGISPENREQIRVYLHDIYNVLLEDMAQSRKLTVNELFNIADNMLVRSPNDALKYKLIDNIGYFDECITFINGKLGNKPNAKINTINADDYMKSFTKKWGLATAKDKIAVIYAEGEINDGEGSENGMIQGARYAQLIRKLRREEDVKAIVLRVNSGGGSALASDNIRRELEMARQQGIPVLVSMGDMAASGGYYISLASDSIFAEPTTLTGSIGVFSMIPSLQKTLKDKVGITFDTVKLGRFAASGTLVRDFSEDEGKILQAMTDSIYEDFLQKVARSRKKTRDQIHEIAQGRVWTGKRALQNGLVDAIGGLDDAVAAAAQKAGLQKYRVAEYPHLTDAFEKLVNEVTGKKQKNDGETKSSKELANTKAAIKQEVIREELGDLYPYLKQIRQMQQTRGVQARTLFAPNANW